MLLHIPVGDSVRHPLIAEAIDQPRENDRSVASANGGDHAVSRQADPAVVDEVRRIRSVADSADQADRPTQVR
jgi:hypothetical protein